MTIGSDSTFSYTGQTGTATVVPNLSYRTLTLNAPGKTFNFTAGATYTVATALNITGTVGASNFVTLRSTSTDTQWNFAVPATNSLSYIDVKDSNNTGTAIDATNTTLFTDSGNNTGWTFDTVAPTTTFSATSNGSAYTANTWTANNVSVTLTCADNAGGTGCNSTKYCTDTTNTCTPTTTYSTAVAITTEGTSYIRYYSTDTVPNTETTASQTIKIDTTNPTTVSSVPKDENSVHTATLTCTDASSSCAYTYYCIDTDNSCAPNNNLHHALLFLNQPKNLCPLLFHGHSREQCLILRDNS